VAQPDGQMPRIGGQGERRIAMSEVTTYRWTIDQDVAGYARHGYEGIEIWLNKAARNGAPYDQLPVGELSPPVVRDLVERLARAGIRAVSVVCAGGLTAIDDDEWEARVEHFDCTIRFAAEIGASCVLVVPGDLHGKPRSAAVRRSARALERVLPIAHRLGIDLAIEPLRLVHTDFVNTIPQALEVLEIVDDRRCGLCLDTYQLWRGQDEKAAVVEEIRQAAAWARIVQVADSPSVPRSTEDRMVPGEGVLPLASMLGELFAAGYNGWLAVEIMSTQLWAGDQDDLLRRCQTGMAAVVADAERMAGQQGLEDGGGSETSNG
jgi:sugar phosphate isomerase/epimerase